jgi:hypothetical protein
MRPPHPAPHGQELLEVRLGEVDARARHRHPPQHPGLQQVGKAGGEVMTAMRDVFALPVRYQEDADVYTHILREGENGYLLSFSQDSSGKSERRARAAAVAINSHDALLEELTQARHYVKVIADRTTDQKVHEDLHRIDAALAAAKAPEQSS